MAEPRPRRGVQGGSSPLPPAERRRYDSPVRREQAARTRERVVVAGWELSPEDATRALTWAIGLVASAVEEGQSPGESQSGRSE
jgi:hypothetical protein